MQKPKMNLNKLNRRTLISYLREALAFPFLLSAKGYAQIVSIIDEVPCICFSLRESTEISETNIEELFDDKRP
jgi:hypothetical protein